MNGIAFVLLVVVGSGAIAWVVAQAIVQVLDLLHLTYSESREQARHADDAELRFTVPVRRRRFER